MTGRPSITAELNALMADLPAIGAAVAVRVAWLRRKAALLWRIAAETDIPAEAADATVLARLAEQSADRIEGGE
jgi:hypothetical protein